METSDLALKIYEERDVSATTASKAAKMVRHRQDAFLMGYRAALDDVLENRVVDVDEGDMSSFIVSRMVEEHNKEDDLEIEGVEL